MKTKTNNILIVLLLVIAFSSCKRNDNSNPCPSEIEKLNLPKTFPYTGNETIRFLKGSDTLYYKGQYFYEYYTREKQPLTPTGCFYDLMERRCLFTGTNNQDSIFISQTVQDKFTQYNYIRFKQKIFVTSDTPHVGSIQIGNTFYPRVQIAFDETDSNCVVLEHTADETYGASGKRVLQFHIHNTNYDLIP